MQRYFVVDKDDNYLLLKKEDWHHIKNVMRNKEGDFIECIYQEKLYICQIEDLGQEKVKIIEKRVDNNELLCDVTVAIALVKEQKMDFILQKLTELGVQRIIPLKMERSIVKLDYDKFAKKKSRWEKICKEASEQSKRNKVPEITELMTIQELEQQANDYKFICSTKNQQNLVTHFLKGNLSNHKVIFVIGPEGGISASEEDLLEKIGYQPISLGKRIMRVETAAIYVASIVNFCSMR